jgi:hypothetical protein
MRQRRNGKGLRNFLAFDFIPPAINNLLISKGYSKSLLRQAPLVIKNSSLSIRLLMDMRWGQALPKTRGTV